MSFFYREKELVLHQLQLLREIIYWFPGFNDWTFIPLSFVDCFSISECVYKRHTHKHTYKKKISVCKKTLGMSRQMGSCSIKLSENTCSRRRVGRISLGQLQNAHSFSQSFLKELWLESHLKRGLFSVRNLFYLYPAFVLFFL